MNKVIEKDEDKRYTLIYEKNDFRMIQWHEDYDKVGSDDTILVQHKHSEPVRPELFSWGHWAYCWDHSKQCADCGSIMPEEIEGMIELCKYSGVIT